MKSRRMIGAILGILIVGVAVTAETRRFIAGGETGITADAALSYDGDELTQEGTSLEAAAGMGDTLQESGTEGEGTLSGETAFVSEAEDSSEYGSFTVGTAQQSAKSAKMRTSGGTGDTGTGDGTSENHASAAGGILPEGGENGSWPENGGSGSMTDSAAVSETRLGTESVSLGTESASATVSLSGGAEDSTAETETGAAAKSSARSSGLSVQTAEETDSASGYAPDLQAAASGDGTLSPAAPTPPLQSGQGTAESPLPASDYRKRLEEIDALLADMKESDASTNMDDLNGMAEYEYRLWDAELNRIYQAIISGMDPKSASDLKQKERQWIRDRDSEAHQAASKYKGGTMESLEYTATLASATRSRCYELLEKYGRALPEE